MHDCKAVGQMAVVAREHDEGWDHDAISFPAGLLRQRHS